MENERWVKHGCGTKDIETKRGNMSSCESIFGCLVLLFVDEQNCQLMFSKVSHVSVCCKLGYQMLRGKSISYFGSVVHDFGWFVWHVTSSLSSLGRCVICIVYLFDLSDLNQFDHHQVLESSLPEELDM